MSFEDLPYFDDDKDTALFTIPLKNGKKLKITAGHIRCLVFGPMVIGIALLFFTGGLFLIFEGLEILVTVLTGNYTSLADKIGQLN